jgi:hypothetical protein
MDDNDSATPGPPLASDIMAMDVNPILSPGAPGIMFSSSILFGNYAPLISLGAITNTVEVRINPIFDNSLTEWDSEVSEKKQKIPLRHRPIQRD